MKHAADVFDIIVWKNSRLEVTQFSVPTTFVTVSVIGRDALCNMSGLTALGSHNTCSMCKRAKVSL